MVEDGYKVPHGTGAIIVLTDDNLSRDSRIPGNEMSYDLEGLIIRVLHREDNLKVGILLRK